MKRLFVALLGLCIVSVAVAATMNFSWINATTNTDGSAIPATGDGSIANTRIEYGMCNAAQDAIVGVPQSITVPGDATATATPALPPGVWCGRAIHINTFGVESDPSNVAAKTIAPPKPNAPRNFTFG